MDWIATVFHSIAVNNVFIREWLNGCLIPLNISMMAIITYTVWRQTKFDWGWTKYPGANSACALWWIFFADLVRSILAWSILRGSYINDQMLNTYRPSSGATIVYMVTGLIATVATLRCIWCLTPVRARNITWISALIFTVVFIFGAWLGLFDWIQDYVAFQVSSIRSSNS